ncbi:bifunctional adenosylcobinamide kinase/adenosylcobinamide-phosphate guanylyltransferase [Metabacillus malikii]|uniref:Adenosylcobinamide kinase n=1 Tax=Metabacillus malikii TaxID=1504265 RepID=A0ABT9ZAX6_9BACI|nr:bifunctional adenosylcobinamide kinase/adenosylcobinamide-phosphate guanylyltransferase [Metabacillus malikii]MDQ0228997.1 adenosylcobinamide kinase/adenosylcobinamide-phosphate guanylyltransferase [Metabacillus malikii]
MHLIIGGAFSGKRQRVRETYKKVHFVSAYDGSQLTDWRENLHEGTIIVLEGFEKWLETELLENNNNQQIREKFRSFYDEMVRTEQARNGTIVLIMLEIGKGIVPLEESERRLRDVMGWITQDAARLADKVELVWNGLTKRMK